MADLRRAGDCSLGRALSVSCARPYLVIQPWEAMVVPNVGVHPLRRLEAALRKEPAYSSLAATSVSPMTRSTPIRQRVEQANQEEDSGETRRVAVSTLVRVASI